MATSFRLWWFWIPVSAFIIQIILEYLLSTNNLSILLSENGPYELIEFSIIAFACALASRLLFKMKFHEQPFLFTWIALGAAGSFYISGEEISWGQHVIGWATPEGWNAINDQGETNLHNTSHWLDQKPRMILEAGVVIGGLIIPILARLNPALLPQKFAIIYPSEKLIIVAAIILLLRLIDIIEDLTRYSYFERISEIQELYLYYFVALYFLFFKNKLKT